MEMKQKYQENTSAEKMLELLKREVNKNRELANEILGWELQDKMQRYQKLEMLLAEPIVTQ